MVFPGTPSDATATLLGTVGDGLCPGESPGRGDNLSPSRRRLLEWISPRFQRIEAGPEFTDAGRAAVLGGMAATCSLGWPPSPQAQARITRRDPDIP